MRVAVAKSGRHLIIVGARQALDLGRVGGAQPVLGQSGADQTLPRQPGEEYVKAKAEPSWRFWGLYVHVCKMETLRAV
jgi:hypothetical protein